MNVIQKDSRAPSTTDYWQERTQWRLESPNVMQLFHVMETGEDSYVVMEHASRGELLLQVRRTAVCRRGGLGTWGHLCCLLLPQVGVAHRRLRVEVSCWMLQGRENSVTVDCTAGLGWTSTQDIEQDSLTTSQIRGGFRSTMIH